MSNVRPCRERDHAAILHSTNSAAQAYRGVIPADMWHEPYMPRAAFDAEIADGVRFWVHERDGIVNGAMGFQPVRDMDLIRHVFGSRHFR